ncbi:MAG: ATP-binding protein [Ilumatobacter sp.]
MIEVGGVLSLTADTNTERLKSIRDQVVRAATECGADDETVADFELVASELTTNVIEHTTATSVMVIFRHERNQWILEVSEAHGLGGHGLSSEPVETPDGRGLNITRAVMDSVYLVDIDDQRFVRCIKSAA